MGKNELVAKSRLVIPGHVADRNGVRVDCPVGPQLALHYLLFLVAQSGWTLGVFDVKDAFLAGVFNDRLLYVKLPREGIPSVEPGSLILLKKGVFGLPESPRLWWVKIHSIIMQAGFVEWQGFPAAFLFFDGETLQGCLVLHVDDGVWAGSGAAWDACQQRVRDMINEHTSMKESKGEKEMLVLGRRLRVSDGEISIDCDDYVRALKTVYVSRERRLKPTDPLTPSEKTSYMSLVAQLAWPA
eukprot:687385-Amphidinium_carterae.1